MYKKIFSAILFGAITFASTSTFVSCKDYDDDINDLQEQINKLAFQTDVDALKAQLESVSGTATSALSTAEAALLKANNAATAEALADVKAVADKAGQDVATAIQQAADAAAAAAAAQSTADAALSAAGNAQSTADAAAAAAGKAQSTADAANTAAGKAQTTADDAKTAAANAAAAAQKAQETADKAVADAAKAAADAATAKGAAEGAAAKADLEAALKRIGDLEVKIKTAEALADRVAKLESTVAGLSGAAATVVTYYEYTTNDNGETVATEKTGTMEEAMRAAQARVKAISEGTNAIWSAVTSVNLFANVHEDITPTNKFDHTLQFLFAIEQGDVKFPANEKVADAQFEFKEDNRPTYADSVLIRISPANAQVDASDIVLINSQGRDLIEEGLVEKVTIEPYTRVYTLTRAQQATGLYVVKFKVKDNVNKDEAAEKEFRDAAFLRENGRDNYIAYAIGVRSGKDSDDKSRYVISEYDLNLRTREATHVYDFRVNNKSINQIHNRYEACEDGTETRKKATEYNWKDEPATEIITEGANLNAIDRYNDIDNRQNKEILNVEPVGDSISITIDFNDYVGNTAAINDESKKIRGFYVTLDQDFALESQPSEINAWVSYKYTGVGYKDPATGEYVPAALHEGNVGTIVVKSVIATGDIIGFRVYAVNLDGTLTDPDGRAFYVKIGKEIAPVALGNVEIKATKQFGSISDAIALNKIDFNSEVTEWELLWGDENPDFYWGSTWYSPINDSKKADYINKNNDHVEWDAAPSYFFHLLFTDASGNKIELQDLADKTKQGIDLSNVTIDIPSYATSNYYGAAGLLDNQAYKLVLKGTRKSNSVSEVLQLITINVTKTLPTELPAVRIKDGQNENLEYTMKPYLNSLTNVWAWGNSYYTKADGTTETLAAGTPAHAWDVRFAPAALYYIPYQVYNFADVYSLINPETGENNLDQNYYFEFANGALNNHNPDDVIPAEIRYNWNGVYNTANFTDRTYGSRGNNAIAYTLPMIQRGSVSVSGVKNDVQIGYTYKNVSLKKDENRNAVMKDVTVPAVNKFTYTYRSAFNLSRVNSTATGTLYYAGGKPEENPLYPKQAFIANNPENKPNVGIRYTPVKPKPAEWFELPYSNDDARTDHEVYLPELIAQHYVYIVEGSESLNGGIKDYFVITDFDYQTGRIEFSPIVDTKDNNIQSDVKGYYSFRIADVMGNQQEVKVNLTMPNPNK